MKIDKRDPLHWLLLLAFFVMAGAGAMLRLVRSKRQEGLVVLYGHKLNGNLLALQQYMVAQPEMGFHPVFLTMDRSYRDGLRAAGIRCCWASGIGCVRLLARARALISDHGLHAMQPWQGLYRRLGMRFIDVWHGIPFKGFDGADFRLLHRYDEVWVASNLCRQLYIERFGFRPERVVVTGYARTDRLLDSIGKGSGIRAGLGLPAKGKLVLFAPTWKQDESGRSVFPFGCSEREFLSAIAATCERHGATAVIRSHFNSSPVGTWEYPTIRSLPASCYPDAEEVLLACDVLVCDWSSIAFDFLLLCRPTIFLDVPPPFRKRLSLGPEFRFGAIATGMASLLDFIEMALAEPTRYWGAYGKVHADARHSIYGTNADGNASQRCVARLKSLVES